QALLHTLQAVEMQQRRARLRAIREMPVEQALCSEDTDARQAARQALSGLIRSLAHVGAQKASVDSTMDLLLRETREARRRRRRHVLFRALFLVGLLLLLWFTHVRFYFLWFFFASTTAWTDRRAALRYEAARKLRTASEPRAVGVLAVAMRDG